MEQIKLANQKASRMLFYWFNYLDLLFWWLEQKYVPQGGLMVMNPMLESKVKITLSIKKD